MLSYTDALNMPVGQMMVSTLNYDDDVECTYADAGTSSSVNCKKKNAPVVPAGTNSLIPAASSTMPASPELAPQPSANIALTPATTAADPATPAAEPTDTTSDSIAGEEPVATNTVVPAEDYPVEEPAESDAVSALPAGNAALPVEDSSVEDYPADEPAAATATNALPADNTVVPAYDCPVEEEPADTLATNALPAADNAVPVEEYPAADLASNISTNAVPAANLVVPDESTSTADPADATSTGANAPVPADAAAASNVPVLGGDYNVAHGTPGYIVGGVKGAKDTFGKPVTADIPSGDVTTTTPPAGNLLSAFAPPASPEETITPSPVSDASPAAATVAVVEPSSSPATSVAPTWETAPVCNGQPTKQTSVQVC
jgi:hypothetical protein